MSAQVVSDLGDEADRYAVMHADLTKHGYRDVADHPRLRPGRRVRHRGEQWPEAFDNGTGVILAVLERSPSSWSASWQARDIELIVLKDKPLLPGMSRLAQLANYHVDVRVTAADRTEATR